VRRLFCLPLFFVLLFSSPLRAEPVVITDGMIVFTDGPGRFEVSGSSFDVRFSWFPRKVGGGTFFDVCPSGCAPGSVVEWGTRSYVNSPSYDIAGVATVGGTSYPSTYFDVLATFTGPTVTLPEPGEEASFANLTGPFTFSGTLTGWGDASRSGSSLFSLELTGSGSAATWFDLFNGQYFADYRNPRLGRKPRLDGLINDDVVTHRDRIRVHARCRPQQRDGHCADGKQPRTHQFPPVIIGRTR
jgi:hypothetical protein